MSLVDVVRASARYWPLVLIPAIVGAVAGWFSAALVTPTYTAQSEMYASARGGEAQGFDVYELSLLTRDRVTSYARITESPVVLERAAQLLGGTVTAEQLDDAVTAEVPFETVMIEVVATAPSAEAARDIANAVADASVSVLTEIETPAPGQESPVAATIIREAGLPDSPTNPKPLLNAALGLFAGIVMGVTVAVLRDRTRRALRGAKDVEAATGLAVYATVPPAAERPHVGSRADKSDPATTNVFRQLAWRLLSSNEAPFSLAVTSANDGDGKTYTTAHLAQAFAASGHSTLIIDADLHTPGTVQQPGSHDGAGLADLLSGRCSFDEAVQPNPGTGLHVMSSGDLAQDFMPPITPAALEAIIQQAYQRFSVVVIDTSSLFGGANGAMATRLADVRLAVVRQGSTRIESLRASAELLSSVGAGITAIVLNRRPSAARVSRSTTPDRRPDARGEQTSVGVDSDSESGAAGLHEAAPGTEVGARAG